MLKLFKSLKILYYVFSIAGVVVLLGCSFMSNLSIMPLFAACLWPFFCGAFFNMLAKKRFNQINDMRVNECRVQDFTQAIEKMNRQSHPRRLDSFIKANLSTGYHDLGQPDKALALLSERLEFPNSEGGVATQLCCLNNTAS